MGRLVEGNAECLAVVAKVLADWLGRRFPLRAAHARDGFARREGGKPGLEKRHGTDGGRWVTDFGRPLVAVSADENGEAPRAMVLPTVELDALEFGRRKATPARTGSRHEHRDGWRDGRGFGRSRSRPGEGGGEDKGFDEHVFREPPNVWHQRRAQRVRCMPGLGASRMSLGVPTPKARTTKPLTALVERQERSAAQVTTVHYDREASAFRAWP